MAKRTIKRWKFLVWEALSKWKRSSGVCQRCGKVKDPGLLDGHHLIPKTRGNYAMFEPDNIVVMCGFYCHRNFWHGSSTWDQQRDLIERWIGLERYEEIRIQALIPMKYKESDYEKMLDDFKGRIR